MASVTKFTAHSVRNHLRHLDREIENPSNEDIDPERSHLNYILSPDREDITDYEYFKQRLGELYVYGRDDVKVMAGWVMTAPQDLEAGQYPAFFRESYRFVAGRYGEENIVSAVVHADEAGERPHLHVYFIPAVPDTNPNHPQVEKVCANDVLTRQELRTFHPDWEAHLRDNGIDVQVRTGVTKANGGNKMVWELKQERQYEHERTWEMRF